MREQPQQILKIEKEQPYIEKHNKWLQEAKIAARSLLIAFGAVAGSEIVKALLPPELNVPELNILTQGLAGSFAATSYFLSPRK